MKKCKESLSKFISNENKQLLISLKNIIQLSDTVECSIRNAVIIIGSKNSSDAYEFDSNKKLYVMLHYSSTSINKKYPFLGFGRISKSFVATNKLREMFCKSVERSKSDFYNQLYKKLNNNWDRIQPILEFHFNNVQRKIYNMKYEK